MERRRSAHSSLRTFRLPLRILIKPQTRGKWACRGRRQIKGSHFHRNLFLINRKTQNTEGTRFVLLQS